MSETLQPLTPSQAAVLVQICAHIQAHGYPPTVRELRDLLGVSSLNGVSDLLGKLQWKGYIQITPKISRGIRVLHNPAGTSVV